MRTKSSLLVISVMLVVARAAAAVLAFVAPMLSPRATNCLISDGCRCEGRLEHVVRPGAVFGQRRSVGAKRGDRALRGVQRIEGEVELLPRVTEAFLDEDFDVLAVVRAVST